VWHEACGKYPHPERRPPAPPWARPASPVIEFPYNVRNATSPDSKEPAAFVVQLPPPPAADDADAPPPTPGPEVERARIAEEVRWQLVRVRMRSEGLPLPRAFAAVWDAIDRLPQPRADQG